MKTLLTLICLLILLPAQLLAKDLRGWDWLIDTLVEQKGMDRAKLEKVYSNKNFPRRDFISFKLKPREPEDIYQAFFQPKRMQIPRKYLLSHKKWFAEAEKMFAVDRSVIAAIHYVETQCGKITGSSMVLNRLSRLVALADPENVRENYEKLKKEDESVTLEQVQERARYLEELFLKEVPAVFEIAERNGFRPQAILGSRAGAFGIPQFLPSNYLKFGIDANKDGRISLFQ